MKWWVQTLQPSSAVHHQTLRSNGSYRRTRNFFFFVLSAAERHHCWESSLQLLSKESLTIFISFLFHRHSCSHQKLNIIAFKNFIHLSFFFTTISTKFGVELKFGNYPFSLLPSVSKAFPLLWTFFSFFFGVFMMDSVIWTFFFFCLLFGFWQFSFVGFVHFNLFPLFHFSWLWCIVTRLLIRSLALK